MVASKGYGQWMQIHYFHSNGLKILITQAKAKVIVSVIFFTHITYVFSHAAALNFDQSLQALDACDYLCLCHWQFFTLQSHQCLISFDYHAS